MASRISNGMRQPPSDMNFPISFTPLYQERVWGGRNLADALARQLPEGKVIGESWEIVDRPEAQSVIHGGEHDGATLRGLIEKHTTAIMGEGYDPNRPFPILVKWLDCQDRLSLQVHPPESVASVLNGEPKTENWYIADTQTGANLIVGLKKGVTRQEFESRLEEGTLESCIHRFDVSPGDSILVESGRLHAIDAGNLILEIQQNSDTTYRVYDWGRVGLDGDPRQLHIEESLQCIDWQDFEPQSMDTNGNRVTLADCKEFRLIKHRLEGGSPSIELDSGEPRILSVVEGEVILDGEDSHSLSYGANVLLPASGTFSLSCHGNAAVLITDRFV